MAASKLHLLLVGIGNMPFPATRHSIGHYILESIAFRLGMTLRRNDGVDGNMATKDVLVVDEETTLTLLKPKPLMNVLGRPVARAVKALDISPSSLIVIQDSLYHQPGTMRYKFGGLPEGHRGIQSINKNIHQRPEYEGAAYHRLQIGIGRGPDVERYVLGPLSAFERQFWSANGEGTDQVWHHIEKIAQKQRATRNSVES